MSFIVKNKILIGYRQDNDNTTVVIPDGIEAIGDRVFRERDKLVSDDSEQREKYRQIGFFRL